jgi:hypothetical protein
MKYNLGKWLKSCYIKPFEFPSPWIHTHPFNHGYQKIDGVYIPYNAMSMYYNDMNAFDLIEKYSKENNVKYDIIMKLRADMFDMNWPTLSHISDEESKICSVKPQCMFNGHGLFDKPIVSDAWVWGNQKSMKIYCDTYNFVLKTLKETKGNYYIAFEDCVTDNVYSNLLTVEFLNLHYKLDGNRRMFDVIERNAEKIPYSAKPIDVKTYEGRQLKPYDPFG